MYTVAQSGLGGTRTDLGAIMLPTKARVEVVQGGTPQTFKGPEFPSIKKNCTVFFAQIKGELESSRSDSGMSVSPNYQTHLNDR